MKLQRALRSRGGAGPLLLGLQRRYGNHYVQRLLSLARQAKEDGEVAPEVEAAIEGQRGGGYSMDQGTQRQMSEAFRADFSGVRVHTDSQADALNHDVRAVAFTTGQDIFFSRGAYSPGTSAGKELLAHELTHVVQQGGSRGVQGKLRVTEPQDAAEREAEQVGGLVGRGAELGSAEAAMAADGGSGSDALQRAPEDESAVTDAGPGAATSTAPVAMTAPAASAGCPTKPAAADPRVIRDTLCLLSSGLRGDDRMNDAFHNNPPLTAADNGDAVRKLQQALLDAGEALPNFGADGKWGEETTRAVASFQGKNGVPVGGGEAGRKTLLALDAHLQQAPPKPAPPTPKPGQAAQVTAQCGQGQQANTVVVTGSGFAPGPVTLTVDGAESNGALADTTGQFTGGVPAQLKNGTHTVEASGGSARAAAQFTTPCGGAAPTPADPNAVTQNELLVLTKYQFMGQTERDATEDAIRDLKGKLDPTPVPWTRKLAEVIAGAAIQFVYGEFEQLLRTSVKNLFSDANAGTVVDNANDKASDFLEDFGKDGLQKAMDDEDQQPTQTLEKQVETFRRTQLRSLREGYLALETGWIAKVQADPVSASITPDQLQGLAKALDETSQKMYKVRYEKTIEEWASYIANSKFGGATITTKVPGKPTEVVMVSSLTEIGDRDPDEAPGVLLIGLMGGGGSKGMPDTVAEMNEQEEVHINAKNVHIFGLSEDARKVLGEDNPPLSSLTMPAVLRGEPRDGGFVAIGRQENGGVIDAGSDKKGKEWLVNVGRAKKRDPTLSDPGEGAVALLQDDLSAATIGNEIQGP